MASVCAKLLRRRSNSAMAEVVSSLCERRPLIEGREKGGSRSAGERSLLAILSATLERPLNKVRFAPPFSVPQKRLKPRSGVTNWQAGALSFDLAPFMECRGYGRLASASNCAASSMCERQ